MLDAVAGASLLALIVTWALYPAAMWLLSRLGGNDAELQEGGAPTVTAVVASRESAAAILARVENLLDTAYEADLDVVVALDRESMPEDTVLASQPEVRCVVSGGSGKAAALNAGVAAATGEVVVFADTYQRFDRATIPRLVAGLSVPGCGAVSGNLELPEGRTLLTRAYWSYERWLRRCEARVHSTVGATGAVYALRRCLWQPLPGGLLLDDVYGPLRVVLEGHRVGFAEGARAQEIRHGVPQSEYRRKVRTLTGVLQVCAWLPAVLVPWRNPVWLQFIMHKLARMLTPYALAGVGLWLLVRGVQDAGAALVPLLLGAGAVLVWATLGKSALAGRARDMVVEGALLQLAVVVAGVNGLRGRWEVWHG